LRRTVDVPGTGAAAIWRIFIGLMRFLRRFSPW
jgi:hypothetical protein